MVTYREIEKKDNEAIAKIIRNNFESHNFLIKGTAYYDPQLDNLYEYYQINKHKRAYFVACESDIVLGGCGFDEYKEIENCAEIQKLYLDEKAKGKGIGKHILNLTIDKAKQIGYKKLYIETHSIFDIAIKMYEKLGFIQIEKPKNSMHFAMNHFYIKEI